MDDDTLRLLIVASVLSLVVHSRSRRFLIACLTAAVVSPFAYAVVESVRHPDRIVPIMAWFPMILGFGITYGFPVAVIVGLPFMLIRKARIRAERRREQTNA